MSILTRFCLIISVLVCLQSAAPVKADPVVPERPIDLPAIPPQLIPPTDDVAHLDEAIAEMDVAESATEKQYQIPLMLNDSVESHLSYFQNRGRKVFQVWLDRSARYLPMMKEIFRQHNVPEDLVYVSMIESGFNPYAVSWAKAVGAWQFMAGTGKLYGLKIDWWIDERKDPIKSTQAAAAHLKDLHNIFGSWPLALASYNAGAGKVHRAVQKTHSDDFWDLRATKYLKKETKNYVPAYMAATVIAKNPEAYGFDAVVYAPLAYDEIELKESTDLRLVARCAEVSYDEIRELNPALKRWITPPHIETYMLRIPAGKKETFLANYAAIPDDQKIKWERHQVRKGETLAGLAKEYKTTAQLIKDVNGLRKNRIAPGKHILIPADTNSKAHDTSLLAQAQGPKTLDVYYYKVRRGESLARIAQKHNVTVADIRGWNKGLGKSVKRGQKIKLLVDGDQI